MPLLDSNHLSPTGQRLTPRKEQPIPLTVPSPATLSAAQLNADIDVYTAEIWELRRLVLLKVMSEIRG